MKHSAAKRVLLTRAEAFRLFMAAVEGSVLYGEGCDDYRPASRRAYERAMSKLARTFRFRDPYPELKVSLATSVENEMQAAMKEQADLWSELDQLLARTAHTLSETVKELRTSDDEASGGINRWHAANRLEKIAKELGAGRRSTEEEEREEGKG